MSNCCGSLITNPCPSYPDAGCVLYSGDDLTCIGIIKNTYLDDILVKLNDILCEIDAGITVNNWLTETSGLVQFGGILIKDTGIDFDTFNVQVSNIGQDDTSPFLMGIDNDGNWKKIASSTFATEIPAFTLPSTDAQNGLNSTFDFPSKNYTVEMGGPLLHDTEIALSTFILTLNADDAGLYGVNLIADTTLASSNFQHLLHVGLSGINDNSGQTTHAGYFSNSHTGSTSRNIGIYAEAIDGTENFAGYFNNTIRLVDPVFEAGYGIDITGGNPNTFSAKGANMVFFMEGINHLQMQPHTATWNVQGGDIIYQFRVSGDTDDNTLYVVAGQGIFNGFSVGINQDPQYTLDVRTKYTNRLATDVFYIGNWVGKRQFPNTDPIPVPVIGFGVGHRFQLENSSEALFEAARMDFVSTAITAASESVDYILRLVNGGVIGPKFTVKSTGAIQTVQPSGNGAGLIRAGKVVAGAVTLDTANYWEIEVDGVIKKVLLGS